MTTDFNLTVDECIEKAIKLSGGEPTSFEELNSARISTNLLLNEWSSKSINLWKVENFQVTVAACSTAASARVSLSSDYIRPLTVAVRYATETNEIGISPISYNDYNNLPKKATIGRPTQYLQERLIDSPKITLWPIPQNDVVLNIWALKKFENVTGYLDNPDVPSRFLSPLTYGVGYKMGLERSTGSAEWEAKLNRLKAEYTETFTDARDDDNDNVNLKFTIKV